jgi:hypothetical protein
VARPPESGAESARSDRRRPLSGGAERSGGGDGWGAAAPPPAVMARWPGGEGDRIAPGMADVLVHELFAVGLDLHAALTYIEANIGREIAVEKIHQAIRGLDGAIRDFRGVVFDLHPDGTAPPAGLRALLVEAVERACGPAGACPAITMGHGVDAVLDLPTAFQLARVLHRVLTMVPGDRLPGAHVEVTADGPPPSRLVVQIDATMGDLCEVAGRVRSLDGQRIEVSCHALARSRSRIRLECRPAPP